MVVVVVVVDMLLCCVPTGSVAFVNVYVGQSGSSPGSLGWCVHQWCWQAGHNGLKFLQQIRTHQCSVCMFVCAHTCLCMCVHVHGEFMCAVGPLKCSLRSDKDGSLCRNFKAVPKSPVKVFALSLMSYSSVSPVKVFALSLMSYSSVSLCFSSGVVQSMASETTPRVFSPSQKEIFLKCGAKLYFFLKI